MTVSLHELVDPCFRHVLVPKVDWLPCLSHSLIHWMLVVSSTECPPWHWHVMVLPSLLSLDPMVDYSSVVCPCAINPWFPAPTGVPPVLRCLVPFVAAPASARSVSQGAMSGPVSAVPFFATTPLRYATSAFCHFVIYCIPPTSCSMSRGAILQSFVSQVVHTTNQLLCMSWCYPPKLRHEWCCFSSSRRVDYRLQRPCHRI